MPKGRRRVVNRYKSYLDSRPARASRRSSTAILPHMLKLEQRVMLSNLPDLVVSAASAPPTAVVGNGQSIDVNWTVTNQGMPSP